MREEKRRGKRGAEAKDAVEDEKEKEGIVKAKQG